MYRFIKTIVSKMMRHCNRVAVVEEMGYAYPLPSKEAVNAYLKLQTRQVSNMTTESSLLTWYLVCHTASKTWALLQRVCGLRRKHWCVFQQTGNVSQQIHNAYEAGSDHV